MPVICSNLIKGSMSYAMKCMVCNAAGFVSGFMYNTGSVAI